MKFGKQYWLISITSLLLLALLVNQIIYVYKAANEQEKAFNDKVNIVMEIITDKIAKNTDFCKSVDNCMFKSKQHYYSNMLRSKKDWQLVNHIIKEELQRFNIDLHYNFDFCNRYYMNKLIHKKKDTYSKKMDKVFQKAGVIMFLEFPEKSKYVFLQIGSVFFSSILFIVLITILFIITFRYYKKERMVAEAIKDFLNNMMHEFKTPLTNISFANNMIAKQAETENQNKIKKYTKIIHSENERIILNCNDILSYAKKEYNLSDALNEEIYVHQILQEIEQSFIASNLSNLRINLQLQAKKSLVNGKSSFLYNALANIVDNAIKYCENTPEILIRTTNKEGEIIISIQDNGIGIPKDKISLVFDKFYRVNKENIHVVKGFGLGLSYSKLIVENMKGKIRISSKINKGSTFTIILPLFK